MLVLCCKDCIQIHSIGLLQYACMCSHVHLWGYLLMSTSVDNCRHSVTVFHVQWRKETSYSSFGLAIIWTVSTIAGDIAPNKPDDAWPGLICPVCVCLACMYSCVSDEIYMHGCAQWTACLVVLPVCQPVYVPGFWLTKFTSLMRCSEDWRACYMYI